MAEILLVRHAQAFANVRDFTAFGNEDSELTDKGQDQLEPLRDEFEGYGIIPEEYEEAVACSKYTRTLQTAQGVGFKRIDRTSSINESDVSGEVLSGRDIILKHRLERWSPDETRQRAAEFISKVRSGELQYQFYFSHGLFIASVLLELDDPRYLFSEKRGYIPLQASITPVKI